MKIDTGKIDGFEAMSAEDKVNALMAYEFDVPAAKDNTDEITKLKATLSKANSEAAEWKRQYREKQTEAERTEAERAEAEQALKTELETLRREKTVSDYAKRCLELGYNADLAAKTAEAMADGRYNDVFAYQQEFVAAKTKEIEAAALNRQPGLSSGLPPVNAADKAKNNEMRSYFGLPPK